MGVIHKSCVVLCCVWITEVFLKRTLSLSQKYLQGNKLIVVEFDVIMLGDAVRSHLDIEARLADQHYSGHKQVSIIIIVAIIVKPKDPITLLTFVDGVLDTLRRTLVGQANAQPQDGALDVVVELEVSANVIIVQHSVHRRDLGLHKLFALFEFDLAGHGNDRLEQTILAVDEFVAFVLFALNVQALVELAEADKLALLEAAGEEGG